MSWSATSRIAMSTAAPWRIPCRCARFLPSTFFVVLRRSCGYLLPVVRPIIAGQVLYSFDLPPLVMKLKLRPWLLSVVVSDRKEVVSCG